MSGGVAESTPPRLDTAATKLQPPANSGATNRDDGSAMPRILIVEDDPFVARLLRTLLTRAGHDAEGATTGTDDVATCEADPPGRKPLYMMRPIRHVFG